MKKLISISETLNKTIIEISKKEKISQSQLIETAMTTYLMLYKGATFQIKSVKMTAPGQLKIEDIKD